MNATVETSTMHIVPQCFAATHESTPVNFCEPALRKNPDQVATAGQTILVVDNYPELCHIAALLLRRYGYRVLTAIDSEHAKRIAREDHIDLLLIDAELPGMAGDEFVAWFRASRRQTQIVFISDHPLQMRRLQPCHFVEKPFIHLDLLVKEVREVLNHGRVEMPASAAA